MDAQWQKRIITSYMQRRQQISANKYEFWKIFVIELQGTVRGHTLNVFGQNLVQNVSSSLF
jgi:hypothetical protein